MTDVAQMLRIKAAMDPSGLCNPGKMFPTAGRCLELCEWPIDTSNEMAIAWPIMEGGA